MIQRRTTERYYKPDVRSSAVSGLDSHSLTLSDSLKFAIFCILLIVPIYAIVHSAINGNWIIMIIDALLVPVGFVHGVLLILGVLT